VTSSFLRSAVGALFALAVLVPRVAGAVDPYEINVILPLTGTYAFVGKGSQAGLAGVEQVINASGGVNGRPIKFVVTDDASSPQNSVQIANALMAKGVPVFFASSVQDCGAIMPLVKDGPVLYCLTPGVHPAAGSYVFSANVASDVTMAVGIRYFHRRGLHRLAILASTDASGQDQEHGVDDTLARPEYRDMMVVAREHYAPPDVSVSAQMARIKAAAPQALLILTVGTPLATALRAFGDSGLDVPVFTSNGNSTYAQMKQYAAFVPNNLLFPDQPEIVPEAVRDRGVREAAQLFTKTLTAENVKPDAVPANTWDAAMLVVSAVKKYGTGITAAQLRAYLAGLRGFPGVMGRYDFAAVPQRGLTEQSVFVVRWDAQRDWWQAVSGPAGEAL
jgi:branched-chain amino acid transport system substrate-binding protein